MVEKYVYLTAFFYSNSLYNVYANYDEISLLKHSQENITSIITTNERNHFEKLCRDKQSSTKIFWQLSMCLQFRK